MLSNEIRLLQRLHVFEEAVFKRRFTVVDIDSDNCFFLL